MQFFVAFFGISMLLNHFYFFARRILEAFPIKTLALPDFMEEY